jgi:hypothetical protein
MTRTGVLITTLVIVASLSFALLGLAQSGHMTFTVSVR